MGDRDGNTQVRLDEYDNLSLWQMIPAGDGKALQKLKAIVNSTMNSHPVIQGNKPLSILLSGEAGKRTYGHAFLRSMGCEDIRFSPAAVFCSTPDLVDFFSNSSSDTGFVIFDLHSVPGGALKKLFEILHNGELAMTDFRREKTVYPVFGTIVMTMKDRMKLPLYLQECFTYSVCLDKYTKQQKELIVLQRLKYANIEMETDEILRSLLVLSQEDIRKMVCLLGTSVMVMMADGRQILTNSDVHVGHKLL